MSERAAQPLSTLRPRLSARLVLGWVIVVGTGLPFALLAFRQGQTDWQYQLAGLADPFLGRPAPGWSIALGAIATVVVLLVGFIGRWMIRRSEPDLLTTGPSSPFHARWWFALIVIWIGYGLGIASVAAGGGTTPMRGPLIFTFGRPIATSVQVAATCRTAVGKPDVIVEVTPTTQGLPRLVLRNPATGERNRYPEPTGAWAELVGGPAASAAYPLPNVPERPLPFLRATGMDGTVRDDPPISFLGSFLYQVSALDERGLSGSATLRGVRITDGYGGGTGPGTLRWMNLTLANDPWPERLDINVEWTCGP